MNDGSFLAKSSISHGVGTAFLITKILTRRSLFEISCFTRSPARTASLFFYGVVLARAYNLEELKKDSSFVTDYNFKRRVEENRRAHDIMASLNHKLDTATISVKNRSDL